MDITTKALLIQTFNVFVALVCSYILFTFLKSKADIKHKGVQLSGAGAMFVVVLLILNNQLSDIQRLVKDGVALPVKIESERGKGFKKIGDVSISPYHQLTTERDLSRLDKNKYYINEKLSISIPQPANDKWIIEERKTVPVINQNDFPFMKFSEKVAGQMMTPDAQPLILSIRLREGIDVEIDKESQIDGVSVGLNPYKDKKFVSGLVQVFMNSARLMADHKINEEKEMAMEMMLTSSTGAAQYKLQEYISDELPYKKTLYSGVYIMPIEDEENLTPSAFSSIFPEESLLARALQFISLQPSAGKISFDNVRIDENAGVASFDGSSELENVLIDGKRTSLVINNVGFIVVGDNRAIFVQLIFLSKDKIYTFNLLNESIKNILFAG